MAAFPVSYDQTENVIRLDGEAGAMVMLGLLTRAKFGERNDPDTLLHPQLGHLLMQLVAASGLRAERDAPFAPAFLNEIGEAVARNAHRIGWWEMSSAEQVAFLQEVVAAPNAFSDSELAQVLDCVEAVVFRAREIAAAADKSSRNR